MAAESLRLLVLIYFLHSIQVITHSQSLFENNVFSMDARRHHHRKLHNTHGGHQCFLSDAYDIAIVLDDTGGLTHLQCYIQKLAVANILKMLKNNHQNPRVTLIQVHGDDCEVVVPLNSGLNDNIEHYVRYVRSVMSCDEGTGVTALDCGLLRAVDEFERVGREAAHQRIIAINHCQMDDIDTHEAHCEALSAHIADDIDVVFINAVGAHCIDVDGQNGTNTIVDPAQYGACVADDICVADSIHPRQLMHAVRNCQHAICRHADDAVAVTTTTTTPTLVPTLTPTRIPTSTPTTPVTPETPVLGADFVLLYDDSCGIASRDCPVLLEGVGEIIAALFDFANSRVQTMSFGGESTHTIVAFEDTKLQHNVALYINTVEQRNACGHGSDGHSGDLTQALYDVLSLFDDDEDDGASRNRMQKLVIVSACIDEDEDEICGELAPQLRTDGVDVYVVNLMASSNAKNVIYNADMAASYLSCLVDNDPYRVCVGEQPQQQGKRGVRIEQFHRVIEQCLWPEICARFTPAELYGDDDDGITRPLGGRGRPRTTAWTTTTTTDYDDEEEAEEWPTRKPTHQPTADPTAMPTPRPTRLPTASPVTTSTTPWTTTSTTEYEDDDEWPTVKPTPVPTTAAPSNPPTPWTTTSTTMWYDDDTGWPTQKPTRTPTSMPTTMLPTLEPTTAAPSQQPTPRRTPWTTTTTTTTWYDDDATWPTQKPTPSPTSMPTLLPTGIPTATPTGVPTAVPTTASPSKQPTPRTTAWTSTTTWYDDDDRWPTRKPTKQPPTTTTTTTTTRSPTTNTPTVAPSTTTSQLSTLEPTNMPTTAAPTTASPTTASPTRAPSTASPTSPPTTTTTDFTTTTTTFQPTGFPTTVPTIDPTADPTTHMPTLFPTTMPTLHPTTASPTRLPTTVPTMDPTVDPTTHMPTRSPTAVPTLPPTTATPTTPTAVPTTAEPSMSPTPEPTPRPTRSPMPPTTLYPSVDTLTTEDDNDPAPFTGPDVPILPVNTDDTATSDADVCPQLSSSSASALRSWDGKFVLFIDNSCKLPDERCNVVLQAAGKLVTQLLKLPNTAVATFDFGQDSRDVRLLVDFDDAKLQRSAAAYATFLETEGECTDNGRGDTDLWSALQHAIFKLSHLPSFDGHPKFIILSSCMDQYLDANMCSTAKQQLDRLSVDVFVVNMMQVSDDKRIENVIQSQSDALLYLSCLARADQVCVADVDDTAEGNALDTVVNECLMPNVCDSIDADLDGESDVATNVVSDQHDMDSVVNGTPPSPSGQDFVVFLDNSCGVSHMVCSHYLYGIQQVVAALFQRPDSRVATIQFGAYQHHTKVLVDFSDAELQSDFAQYRKVLFASAQCNKGGAGETDLLYALEMSENIIDDNRKTNFVVVSMCQEADDSVCTIRSQLQARRIEVHVVNLLSASPTRCADNAILTADEAGTYLSCLATDDDLNINNNEICVGDVRSDRDIWAFPDILNDCLIPQIANV